MSIRAFTLMNMNYNRLGCASQAAIIIYDTVAPEFARIIISQLLCGILKIIKA